MSIRDLNDLLNRDARLRVLDGMIEIAALSRTAAREHITARIDLPTMTIFIQPPAEGDADAVTIRVERTEKGARE